MRLDPKEYPIIHNELTDPELVSIISDKCHSVGLNQIDFDNHVSIEKMSAKNRSPIGYPDRFRVIEGAVAQVLGDLDGHIWLYMFNPGQWFRTSPIIRVEKLEVIDNRVTFMIETENSVYHLHQRLQ